MSNYFVMRKNDWTRGQIMSRSRQTVKVLVKYVVSLSDDKIKYAPFFCDSDSDSESDSDSDDRQVYEAEQAFTDFQIVSILGVTHSKKIANILLKKNISDELSSDLEGQINGFLTTPDFFTFKRYRNYYIYHSSDKVGIIYDINLILYRLFEIKINQYSLPLAVCVKLSIDAGQMAYDEYCEPITLHPATKLRKKILDEMELDLDLDLDLDLSIGSPLRSLSYGAMSISSVSRNCIELECPYGSEKTIFHLFHQVNVIHSIHFKLLLWRKAVERTARQRGVQRKEAICKS